MKNHWLNGIMGVIIGDALGCPVQFLSRTEIKKRGVVRGMEGYGTYHMPPGTWTDDGSMTLATADSLREKKAVDLDDIMKRFVSWYEYGEYTPFGEAFDMGITCSHAIENYERTKDVSTCGETAEHSNGNGSLMRILPVCLYEGFRHDTDEEIRLKEIGQVSGLTHNHLRSRIACGLYYFMVKALLEAEPGVPLRTVLQRGIDIGVLHYGKDGLREQIEELEHYSRLFRLEQFVRETEDTIRSTGYVVDTLEAAVWCLITTDSFEECLLKAVNLGDDTDTVGAVCGGLAGLYYGYENMPGEWLSVVERREWIENICVELDRLNG